LTKDTSPARVSAEKKQLGPGATAQYKGKKVLFTLDRTKVSEELIVQLEELLTRRRT